MRLFPSLRRALSGRHRRLALALGASIAVLPAPVFAYVDPSAGSILLQLLLGGGAGLLIVLKLSFGRLTRRFGRRSIAAGGERQPRPADPPR